MIAALDVRYCEEIALARAAAVVFERWTDSTPVAEYTTQMGQAKPYVPGQFYRRELPCLQAVLRQVVEPLDVLVIDGYVALGDQPGLGMHLWEAMGRRPAVIGVAKTLYRKAPAIAIRRGRSRSLLYITALGIDRQKAAEHIRAMHGAFRIRRC